jgi:hypothetical protein
MPSVEPQWFYEFQTMSVKILLGFVSRNSNPRTDLILQPLFAAKRCEQHSLHRPLGDSARSQRCARSRWIKELASQCSEIPFHFSWIAANTSSGDPQPSDCHQLISCRPGLFRTTVLFIGARLLVCAKNMVINLENPVSLNEVNQAAAMKKPASDFVSNRDSREQLSSERAQTEADKSESDFHFNSKCESW